MALDIYFAEDIARVVQALKNAVSRAHRFTTFIFARYAKQGTQLDLHELERDTSIFTAGYASACIDVLMAFGHLDCQGVLDARAQLLAASTDTSDFLDVLVYMMDEDVIQVKVRG